MYLKANTAHKTLQGRIAELVAKVNTAEDGVFTPFCRKIGVSNIREYEERQLKLAQEESQARLRFDTQIARLTNQYVLMLPPILVELNHGHRADFESEGLKQADERLVRLEAMVQAEQANLERLGAQKVDRANDIKDLEANISILKEELRVLQDALDEKTKAVDAAKKAALKASKVLDQSLKEITTWVSVRLLHQCVWLNLP